jgi:hypothetical protein
MTQPMPDPNTASEEPLLTIGTVVAFASAVLGVLVAFGLPLTGDQRTAILSVVGVAAPVVVAIWGRQRVYAPASVAALLGGSRGQH